MSQRLTKRAKYAIISFLVDQEQHETQEEAKKSALEWAERSDQALMEAHEYNLVRAERQVETYV